MGCCIPPPPRLLLTSKGRPRPAACWLQVDTLSAQVKQLEGQVAHCREVEGALRRAEMAKAEAEEKLKRCAASCLGRRGALPACRLVPAAEQRRRWLWCWPCIP